MKEWYQMSTKEVVCQLQSTKQGLSSEEAAARLARNGRNVLAEGRRKSIARVFAEQFCDLLVWILVIAAIVSALTGSVESTVVILVVITMNAVLGTVQYVKAQKSLDSLKQMASPTATVIRDGVKQEIGAEEVVAGDLLELSAGDLAAADGRILSCHSLQVNESALTGESANVEKTAEVPEEASALGDRVNMVYAGGLVTYGRAQVLVTGTGMETEMGKIARLMNDTGERKTPLQVSLDQFSGKLAVLIMVICALVFGMSLYRGMGLLDSMMFAVALAVAAIPEALGSIVTIVQALGTQKMAKEHAIIKDLKAVESLGCVSVICTDKTGTLTQNKMTVQSVYVAGEICDPAELTWEDPVHRAFLYNAVLNNDSDWSGESGIGDPTETALLAMAESAGVDVLKLRTGHKRLEELPFDSDRKRMSTRYRLEGQDIFLTKGAFDVLLKSVVQIAGKDGIRVCTGKDKEKIEQVNRTFSEKGLRVLAFVSRQAEAGERLNIEAEDGYTFLGLAAMIDPPREESADAVLRAGQAGIRTVMITGDHKVTATAIARQIGIFREGDIALTGPELDAMTDPELDTMITRVSVYARVSPENKIRIVDAWQRKGKIVSMTGDGVNDAPALKKADIGVAMGVTGTEVAKDAAAMILTDDNFATIIQAVANGRNVYRNIKHAIGFLLAGNMAGILAVLYTSLRGLPVPFAPVHLLFINLLTDSLPALAIGMEPSEKDLLKQKPRGRKESLLDASFLKQISLQGLLIAAATLAAYTMGLKENPLTGATMAFATLTLARLFHGFNCRSRHSLPAIGFRKNPYSLWAFAAGVILLVSVLGIPALHGMFQIADLTTEQFGWIWLWAVLPTGFIQIGRIVRERIS